MPRRSQSLSLIDLILKKRSGEALPEADIESFVRNLESFPDYQVSAFLAFCFCKGLNEIETAKLTKEMQLSGEQLDRKKFPKEWKFIDKHSTGGVGDKISLPLAPLVVSSSENLCIPMIAGRSLGHTGGTVDKLESLPGLQCLFTKAKYERLLRKNRLVFSGQSHKIAPADKKLYALRDVTGTVPSIPLIVASILSKKLSASLDYLLFDVKFGSGAFMKTLEEAEELAVQLLRTAQLNHLKSTGVLTSMNQPLGKFLGNALEVEEAVQILQNAGPKDSSQLSLHFAERMLQESGMGLAAAQKALQDSLQSGRAYECFENVIAQQGGRLDRFLKRKKTRLKKKLLKSSEEGYLRWDVESLGHALNLLGAGRTKASDKIDHEVGIELIAASSQKIQAGDPLLYIYYSDAQKLRLAEKKIKSALFFDENKSESEALIQKQFET